MILRLNILALVVFFAAYFPNIYAQKSCAQPLPKVNSYNDVLERLKNILDSNGSFEKAVFISEAMFLSENDDSLKSRQINNLIDFMNAFSRHEHIKEYKQPDSLNFKKNWFIFSAFFDSLRFKFNDSVQSGDICLFSYIPDGSENAGRSNMFVSNLLLTARGNCHSLSYLYKIIADRIGAKCWLALAPNHIYIKNFSQQYGWYNTELTSRTFPTDAWIMASAYISGDAVRSKIYMDTLSNQQSIGLCILDLAKAYEYETRNYYDGFILKCCDLVLRYHATNPMALLLKAETLKKVYLKQKAEKASTVQRAYNDMENAYIVLAKLHYREMPKEMYDKWVRQMKEQTKQ